MDSLNYMNKKISFIPSLKKFISEDYRMRSYEDINAGILSHSEPVFFQIQKYDGDAGGEPIQNILLPVINDDTFTGVAPLEYIDTQVKYDRKYTYVINIYNLVIGTKYYFENVSIETPYPRAVDLPDPSAPTGSAPTGAPGSGMATYKPSGAPPQTTFGSGKLPLAFGFKGATSADAANPYDIVNRPYFKADVLTVPIPYLTKTELFRFSGKILDDPPIMPDVVFVPYIGIDNKIRIHISAQVGEYDKIPIVFPADEKYIAELRSCRGLSSTDPIHFKSDDELEFFDIYRTTTEPTSYADFEPNLRTSISTFQKDMLNNLRLWHGTLEDSILPNTVYYYMVRSVDIHGHSSDPSSVYKVQMINDSGAIYPLIEIHSITEPPEPKMKMKKFQQFLRLKPAAGQTFLNLEESGLASIIGLGSTAIGSSDSIVIGNSDERLFSKVGKKFKIRLTSKNSGKKIDFNVSFKLKNEPES